jgi:hypothetical protein
MAEKTVAQMIVEAYERDSEKNATFFETLRVSRKYGFPIVNGITNKPQAEQRVWAARFLLSLSETWPQTDVPMDDAEFQDELLELMNGGSALGRGVDALLSNATSNSQQLGHLVDWLSVDGGKKGKVMSELKTNHAEPKEQQASGRISSCTWLRLGLMLAIPSFALMLVNMQFGINSSIIEYIGTAGAALGLGLAGGNYLSCKEGSNTESPK